MKWMQKLSFISLLFAVSFISSFTTHARELEKVPGLMVGSNAPDFTATTHTGEEVKLSELYQNGPVVLVFYRGAWCPYCNLHLQQFEAKKAEFERANATILAISVDLEEYANKVVEGNQLSFHAVSDPSAKILEAYNLLFTVPADLVEKYKNEYQIDLVKHSGRTDGVIAVPATYVINQDGVIVFGYASKDYKVRTSPDEVLQVLHRVIG